MKQVIYSTAFFLLFIAAVPGWTYCNYYKNKIEAQEMVIEDLKKELQDLKITREEIIWLQSVEGKIDSYILWKDKIEVGVVFPELEAKKIIMDSERAEVISAALKYEVK
ncbi:MAG: hypothetical protein KBT02_00285 [Treponema sp.]|nr:hypothetical protein [Candidatus Treponema caballi]